MLWAFEMKFKSHQFAECCQSNAYDSQHLLACPSSNNNKSSCYYYKSYDCKYSLYATTVSLNNSRNTKIFLIEMNDNIS